MLQLVHLLACFLCFLVTAAGQDQVRINFDEPLPDGVSIDISCYNSFVACWSIDSDDPNPVAVGNHLHYGPFGNTSQSHRGSARIIGVDLTNRCRLSFDIYRPQGSCSSWDEGRVYVGNSWYCLPLTSVGTRVDLDISQVSGVQDIRFWFDYGGAGSQPQYGISIDNIAIGTDLDCNANCIEDAIEISQQPGLDLDLNGVLDQCESGGPLWIRSPFDRFLYSAIAPSQWADANTSAGGIGGVLAMPKSSTQNAWLAATFGGADAWIGLSDAASEGLWAWLDGSAPTYSAWAPGEPGDFDPALDFAALNPLLAQWSSRPPSYPLRALVRSASEDCDGNGLSDDVDLLANPSLDCNGNGLMDACELLDAPQLDCDGDGVLDECQLSASSDCDGNGALDSCELIANADLDCNGNNLLDLCETIDPSDDWNGDGLFDSCVPANYCVSTQNSSGSSGSISVTGSPLAAAQDFTLHASGLPNGQWSYFIASQGQTLLPGLGGGQGTLCVAAPITRLNLGVGPGEQVDLTTSSGTRTYEADFAALPSSLTLSPGETWNFQLWFRDVNPGLTSNTTDGISVMFR